MCEGLMNVFGNCNIVDGLNFGEIRMRGEGMVVDGFLKKVVNGWLFCVLSGGRLNLICVVIFLWRLDFCLGWWLVWGKILLIWFIILLLLFWFSIVSSDLGLGLDGVV